MRETDRQSERERETDRVRERETDREIENNLLAFLDVCNTLRFFSIQKDSK